MSTKSPSRTTLYVGAGSFLRRLAANSRYLLDDMGDRVRATDPEGRVTEWSYDLRRRQLVATRKMALANDTDDEGGNPTSIEESFSGETGIRGTSFSCDDFDRVPSKVNPGGVAKTGQPMGATGPSSSARNRLGMRVIVFLKLVGE